MEALRELGPGLLGRRAAAELVDCRAGVCPELLVRQGLPRGADDPVALGKEAGFGEMEEPRHELSPREVTGRSEEDDDVILGRREGVVRVRVGWVMVLIIDDLTVDSDSVRTRT